MYSPKPILITGSHRSGSTWVGNIIAQSPQVHYIAEPFNLNNYPCKCGQNFNYWFQYIASDNESIYYNHIKHAIGLSSNFIGEAKAIKTSEAAFKLLIKQSKFLLRYSFGIRPLVKDPIALFSAEWLASKFNMDVLVLIRHPAAFVSSLKRLNWKFPFSHFLEQPLLMESHLQVFEDEIRKYAEHEHDIIDQAILLWKIIHYTIIRYKTNNHSWLFMRHEDISQQALKEFKNIFDYLKLDFTEEISKAIQESTSQSNSNEIGSKVHILKRDSKSNIWAWKNRLTPSEIKIIRTKVEEVSGNFYSDKDW